MKKVLEIGTYIIPAYAGMILREQGHHVTKWIAGRPDPIHDLNHGPELWAWLNTGKEIHGTHAAYILNIEPGQFDIVIDNIRPATWNRWGISPTEQAERLGCTWVTMRDDICPNTGRSFDAIAQARAWGDHIGYLPIYLGDTAGGLWLAFKALAAPPGHHVLHQATALAKLVEGELMIDVDRSSPTPPWDNPGDYGQADGGVAVRYRDNLIYEPFRDQQWRREHLHHHGGRLTI